MFLNVFFFVHIRDFCNWRPRQSCWCGVLHCCHTVCVCVRFFCNIVCIQVCWWKAVSVITVGWHQKGMRYFENQNEKRKKSIHFPYITVFFVNEQLSYNFHIIISDKHMRSGRNLYSTDGSWQLASNKFLMMFIALRKKRKLLIFDFLTVCPLIPLRICADTNRLRGFEII